MKNPDLHHVDCDYRNSTFARDTEGEGDIYDCNLNCEIQFRIIPDNSGKTSKRAHAWILRGPSPGKGLEHCEISYMSGTWYDCKRELDYREALKAKQTN